MGAVEGEGLKLVGKGATMGDTSVLLLLVGTPLPVGTNVELAGAIDEGALLVVVFPTRSGVGAMVVSVSLLVVLVGVAGLKVLEIGGGVALGD